MIFFSTNDDMTTAAVTTITNAAITKSADPVVTAYTSQDTITVDRLRACQHALPRFPGRDSPFSALNFTGSQT